MKTTIITSIIALVSVLSAIAQEKPAPTKPAVEKPAAKDPIGGRWKVQEIDAVWSISSDNTARSSSGRQGTWKKVKSDTVESKYEIMWAGGKTIAEVTVDRTGNKMRVKESTGKRFTGERIGDVE